MAEPAEHLGLGCCSIGAEFADVDEARMIAALAATLDPDRFERHADAGEGGIFSDDTRTQTRVLDGACIFFEPPRVLGRSRLRLAPGRHRYEGVARPLETIGVLAAAHQGRLQVGPADAEVATARPWSRRDWGPEGDSMAWCCTEGSLAYVGSRPVIDSLGAELTAIVGTEVYVELRRRITAE